MSCQVLKSPYANEEERNRKSNLGLILIKLIYFHAALQANGIVLDDIEGRKTD